MSNSLPYIGCTDFRSLAQVLAVQNHIDTSLRRLHVGVMCSYKTVNGLPSQWTDVWPSSKHIHEIFDNVVYGAKPFNVIHYADYDAQTTISDLKKAMDRCGPNVHGIQLDMIWPNVDMVHEFRELFHSTEIILQVSSKAMDVNPFWMKTLEVYKPSIDYVLLDAGMGKGTTFYLEEFESAIYATRANFREDQIAIAGGLGPLNHQTRKAAQLLEKFPQLSVDAQSKLRPSESSKDPLDTVYAAMYAQSISNIVKGKR